MISSGSNTTLDRQSVISFILEYHSSFKGKKLMKRQYFLLRSGYSPGGRSSKTYLPGRRVNNLLLARQRKKIRSRRQLTYSCFRVRFHLTYFTTKSKVHQNPKYTMPSKYQTDHYPTHSTSTTQQIRPNSYHVT